VFASHELHEVHAGVAKGGEWTGKITKSGETVWKSPFMFPSGSRVFACSMSDFWHEHVPLPWLDAALDVIDLCRRTCLNFSRLISLDLTGRSRAMSSHPIPCDRRPM
jgi:protein gp37